MDSEKKTKNGCKKPIKMLHKWIACAVHAHKGNCLIFMALRRILWGVRLWNWSIQWNSNGIGFALRVTDFTFIFIWFSQIPSIRPLKRLPPPHTNTTSGSLIGKKWLLEFDSICICCRFVENHKIPKIRRQIAQLRRKKVQNATLDRCQRADAHAEQQQQK